jgi:hypothetical protein
MASDLSWLLREAEYDIYVFEGDGVTTGPQWYMSLYEQVSALFTVTRDLVAIRGSEIIPTLLEARG